MTQAKIEFKAGLVSEDSEYASEGGFVRANMVRFWRGKAQVLGGWQLLSTETFWDAAEVPGKARAGHDWKDLDGNPLLAWGTARKLWALVGGAQVEITPPLAEGVLGAPFSTTNGSGVVTVKHPLHGLATGNTITFANASPIAGLTLNGTFPVAVINRDSYQITAPGGATANATITSGSTATVDYVAPLPAGNVDAVPVGYGSGNYGEGPYGTTTITDPAPRLWALDNFGEDLVAVPRGGGLYCWQPAFGPGYGNVLLNGDFATDSVWAKGTGWTISGGQAVAAAGSASNLNQNVANLVTPGKTVRVKFSATVNAGTLKVQVAAGNTLLDVNGPSGFGASTPITASGTYTRTFIVPNGMTDIVFVKDAAFAGSLDNVTLGLESRAFRVQSAPSNIMWAFVDPNGFVVLLGTQGLDGVFDPALVRWSGLQQLYTWVTDNDNLAGEYPIRQGGALVTGKATRQQNLLCLDSAEYTMQYTGSPATVFVFRQNGEVPTIASPNAMAEDNGAIFSMRRREFRVFNGATSQKLDCPIRSDVFDNIDEANSDKIYAGINGEFSEVWFFVPDKRYGVECNRAIVYNYAEQLWSTHLLDRTCMVAAGLFPNPIMFSAKGLIFEHEVGQTANGNPIVGFLETAYFDVEDGNNLMNILRIVPDFKGQTGPVDFTLKGRPFPNGPEWTWGPWTSKPDRQKIDLRRTARQMKMRLDFGFAPMFFRFGAITIDAQKSGALR